METSGTKGKTLNMIDHYLVSTTTFASRLGWRPLARVFRRKETFVPDNSLDTYVDSPICILRKWLNDG